MPSRYLLPCPQCGENQSIEFRQAGERIQCQACDASIDVPRLSGIRQLEPDTEAESTARPPRDWGFMRGLLFSGGLAAILMGGLSATAGSILYARLDPGEDLADLGEEEFAAEVDEWTIEQTMQFWDEQVVPHNLGEWRESQAQIDRRYQRVMFWVTAIGATIAVIGIGSVVASMVRSRTSGASSGA